MTCEEMIQILQMAVATTPPNATPSEILVVAETYAEWVRQNLRIMPFDTSPISRGQGG